MQKTISVGIDLVNLLRFHRLIARHGERALTDLFSDADLCHARLEAERAMGEERAYSEFDTCVLAGKFAAKEASVKALALPPSLGYRFSDISVSGRSSVSIQLSERLRRIARTQSIDSLFGCVTCSRETAMAIVFGVSYE